MTDRPIIFSAPIEFTDRVLPEPNSGCWLWDGPINDKGYGRFHHSGRSEMAHRAALRFSCMRVPPGFEVDHLCRVRCCVNPIHLEVVTHRENLLRGDTITARAAATTHCPKGHSLTGENVSVRDGKRHCLECGRQRASAAYRPTTSRRRRRHLTADEVAGIRAAISEGAPHLGIAKQFDVSIATVSNVRRGANRHD